MNQKFGTIYIPTNLINGKQYVGQTIRIKRRIWEHKNDKRNLLFPNAIKKYGIENFKIISFSCPKEDLDWTETFLINELNTLAPNGYNLETGGHKNKHHSEITKQKMSLKNKGENNPMFGKTAEESPSWGRKHTEEELQLMREIKTGKTLSETHREKLRGPRLTIRGDKSPNRKRMGEKHPMAKAVILISPECKKYNLPCYVPFCKEHNLSKSAIRLVLQGKRKHHKGWTGKYL